MEDQRATPDVDSAAVERCIRRAVTVRTAALDRGQVEKLSSEIADFVAVLLPVARSMHHLVWQGSLEWHHLLARLDAIDRQVDKEIEPGALAGHVHVRMLAHDLQWLVTWIGAHRRPAAPHNSRGGA